MPDTFLCDSVSLDASPPDTVERDASGVPVAWRLLAPGENTLNKAGLPLVIDLTPERLKQALGYYAEKGEKIPIDSSHYLSDLADAHDIAESEVERMIPSGVAAMGYGELEEREGALWITRVDWKDAAGKLIAEGIYKYFSPKIRGLKNPPFRVTCVALENEPAINDLDELAASAANDIKRTQMKGHVKMKTSLIAALAHLTGVDSLSLAADDKGEKQDTLACAVEGKAKVVDALRESLKLDDGTSDEAILAALKGAVEKAGGYDAVKAELDAVKAEAETEKRDKLIEEGKAEGKLTDAQDEWAKTQDSESLSAYLRHAPVVVPLKRAPAPSKEPAADTVSLSADERTACRLAGIGEARLIEIKKQKKA